MEYLTMRPIGFVHSPFSQSDQIPRGLGAKHEEEGVLEILPEFEAVSRTLTAFLISTFCGSSTEARATIW